MGIFISCLSSDTDEAGVADQAKVKKGWSFRKGSSSGRAMSKSNSLVAEIASPGQKENLDSAAVNYEAANESVVLVKESALQLEEKKPPPMTADFAASDAITVSENEKHPAAIHLYTPNTAYVSETEKHNGTSNMDVAGAASVPEPQIAALCVTDDPTVSKTEYEAVISMHEADVIVIQSGVRGFLARKEQIKHKSVIKLQAVSLASPGAVDDHTRGTEIGQEVRNIGKKEHEENFIVKEQEEKIAVEDYLFQEENEIFLEAKDFAISGTGTISEFSKSNAIEEANPINSGEITKSIYDKDSLSAASLERPLPDAMGEVNIADSATTTRICSVNLPVNAKENTQPEIVSANEYSELEQAQELYTELERIKLEVEDEEVLQFKMEDDNIVSGPSKESGLTGILEPELISKLIPSDSVEYFDSKLELESVSQDIRVEEPISDFNLANGPSQAPVEEPATVSNSDISVPLNDEAKELIPHSSEFDLTIESGTCSGDEITINHRELSQQDNSTFQVDESECGTELTITSTLDSPSGSDIGPVELKRIDAGTHIAEEPNFVEVEVKTESISVEKEESGVANGEPADYATAAGIIMEEKEPEANASHQQLQPEERKPMTSVSDLPAEPQGVTERSQQASPGSQVTFSESRGTPSSQALVSTNPKRAKSEKSGSMKKHTILSSSKRSPLTSNNDSDGKSSPEQLPKEQKSVKRRTSLGSPKPIVSEQEKLRDIRTSSSLPSYMQATFSARAKANAGHSPQSSPDAADHNDIFLRKRYSLSGAKDRQHTPRLHQTSSPTQPGTKSNGTSPLEREWQRLST